MRFKHIIIPVFLLFSIEFAEAQSSLTFDKLFSVGIHITKPEYKGDLGNSMWDVNSGQKGSYWYYWGGGASFSVNLNSSFFISLDVNYGNYGFFYKAEPDNFLSNKLDFTSTAHYRLNNGYILKEDVRVAPFLSLGIGAAKYFYNSRDGVYKKDYGREHRLGDETKPDLIVPFGGGVQFNISKDLAVRYQYLIYLTSSDGHDGNYSTKQNDMFGQHTAGIIFSFGNIIRKDKCHCNF
ncbi:MAG: outer membrane beta-barrel protein [Paludibacter sp.]